MLVDPLVGRSVITVSYPIEGHLLNLIDTPGHADFTEEVSRSLAVCDGILFLVAANQGVQVDTFSSLLFLFIQHYALESFVS